MREIEIVLRANLTDLARRINRLASLRRLPSVRKGLSGALNELATDVEAFSSVPDSALRALDHQTVLLIQKEPVSGDGEDGWFDEAVNLLGEIRRVQEAQNLSDRSENLLRERAQIRRAVVEELDLRSEVFSRGEALNQSMTAALSRLEQLESALTIVRRQTAEAISVMENEHRATFTSLEADASGVLGTMQGHERQARALLQYVGDQGASAGYNMQAAQSRGGRRIWQFITVISFVAWIIWQAKAYSVFPSVELSLPVVLRSFLSAMPFALLTGFGVLQVARFSAAEERNRRAQLEIFAMEPLLTGLEVADQKELRKLLIPHFYRADSSHATGTAKELEANGPQLLQRFLDLIGKK